MIGFSQSSIASMSRWKPSRIMCVAPPTTMSGAPSGFGFPAGCGTERSAPVQKCRSPARGQHDRAHVEVGVRVPEVFA